jgi:decaprenylphospho-beta-D-ribofuranose 2-oxidase
VQRISDTGHVSCLNVLKRFGPGDPAPMSFPTPGWTLAVDLAVRPGLAVLLAELDELVADAGGRVYLAKDARLPAATAARMYPRLGEFRAVLDRVDPKRVFVSDLARRLEML